jgi:hypothetical protein
MLQKRRREKMVKTGNLKREIKKKTKEKRKKNGHWKRTRERKKTPFNR